MNPVSYNVSFLTIRETSSHEWNVVHTQLLSKESFKPQIDTLSTHQNQLAAQVDLWRYSTLTKLPTVDKTAHVASFFTNENNTYSIFLMTSDNTVSITPGLPGENAEAARRSTQLFARLQGLTYVEPYHQEKESITSPAA